VSLASGKDHEKKGTEMINDAEKKITLALLEAKQRFPDVISLQFDPVTHEVVDYEFHNAGYAQHEQFHQAQQYMEETIKPLAKQVLYGDKTDRETAFELMHDAVQKYPKVFSFDTDESGNPTEFRVKYDTKKNSARTIEAAQLYCKQLHQELATLDRLE